MGTVLSISPTNKKASIMDAEGNVTGDGIKNDKSLKRHSMFVSLSWKKLVSNSAKKSAKKVSPNPVVMLPPPPPSSNQVALLNSENSRKTEEKKPKAPIPVPVPTVPKSKDTAVAPLLPQNGKLSDASLAQTQQQQNVAVLSPRRVVIQASTGELLRCLGDFICRRCSKLKELSSGEVILWFRNIDRTLLLQGWQDQGFITPANLVFVYLLCEEAVAESVESATELQGTFQTCLYLAYSYMGNEISYPLKPFMSEANKDVFWDTSLRIIDRLSDKMLQLNADPHFFTEVFQDLKNQRETGETNLDR